MSAICLSWCHPWIRRRQCPPSNILWKVNCCLLLTVLLASQCCDGFPTYLLTGSGCYTELDPVEVIMNAAVIPFRDQLEGTAPRMNLVVNGHVPKLRKAMTQQQLREHQRAVSSNDEDDGGVLQLSIFPATLALQVMPLTTGLTSEQLAAIADYQFALDIVQPERRDDHGSIPDAAFPRGGCDRKRRVIGRKHDAVELTVRDAAKVPVRVVGGWAAGHGAVKLTPVLTIRHNPWTAFLRDDCRRDVPEISRFQGYRFVEAVLHLNVVEYAHNRQKPVAASSSSSYVVKLLGNSNIEVLVLECQHCKFISGGVGTVLCDGHRVILDAVLLGGSNIDLDDDATSWPVAVVATDPTTKQLDAIVTGMYSIATEPELRRVKPVALQHSQLRAAAAFKSASAASDGILNHERITLERHSEGDPQKAIDAQARYPDLFKEQANRRRRQDEEGQGSSRSTKVHGSHSSSSNSIGTRDTIAGSSLAWVFFVIVVVLAVPIATFQACLILRRGGSPPRNHGVSRGCVSRRFGAHMRTE